MHFRKINFWTTAIIYCWMLTIAPAMSQSLHDFPGIGNRADWARAQAYFLASLDQSHIGDPLEPVITAIKIYPYDQAFYCQSADLRLRRAEVAQALEDIKLAISLDPDSSRSWCVYGNVLTSKGDFNGAVEALETSVKLEPTNAEAWHSLGFGYSLLHEDDKGEQARNKCLNLKPTIKPSPSSIKQKAYPHSKVE